MKVKHLVNLTKGMKRGAVTSLRRIAGRDKLQYLWLGLTDRCNSRCKTCNIWRKEPGPEMSLQELRSVLEDPVFKDVKYIINSGGEPTLRKDLEEVLLMEHEVLPKAAIQLSTNGLLPLKILDLAGTAVKEGIELDIGISLDGIGVEHDIIRGVANNFLKLDRIVSVLSCHPNRVSVSVGSTPMNWEMLENVPDVKKYADYYEIPYMLHWFDRSEYYANEEPIVSDYYDSWDRADEAKAFIKSIRSTMPRTLYYDMWLKRLAGEEARFWCFALHTFLVIQPNGNVAPCLHFWDHEVGNVLQKPPSEIWNSDKMKSWRYFLKNCSDCLNSWCVGWSLNSYYWPVLLYEIKKKFPELFAKSSTKKEGMV